MKKVLLMLVLVLSMALVFTACGTNEPAADPAADTETDPAADSETEAVEPIHLSLGWLTAATGTTHAEYCNAFKQLVEERTNGEIIIDLYPAAQLGQGRDLYEAMILGDVDIAFDGTSVLAYFTDKFYIFDVPLLFRSYDEVFYLMDDEEFMKPRFEEVEALGLHILGLTEIGFFNYVSTVPIEKPEDFSGLTVRTTENKVAMAWLASLGANPAAMSFSEAFTSIQNGTVDAVNMPIPTMYTGKYYTAVDYFDYLDINSTAGLLIMSGKTYEEKLTAEQRTIVDECAKEAITIGRGKMAELIEQALAGMEADGATIIKPDITTWYETFETVCWPAIAETGLVSMDEIVEIHDLLQAEFPNNYQ